jgi:addiction module RelE/StbE family toxin
MDILIIESKTFSKQIAKADKYVQARYMTWFRSIKVIGLDAVQRQIPWRDHELIGDRKGQRSVKLGGKWRVIYTVTDNEIEIIEVKELIPHDY